MRVGNWQAGAAPLGGVSVHICTRCAHPRPCGQSTLADQPPSTKAHATSRERGAYEQTAPTLRSAPVAHGLAVVSLRRTRCGTEDGRSLPACCDEDSSGTLKADLPRCTSAKPLGLKTSQHALNGFRTTIRHSRPLSGIGLPGRKECPERRDSMWEAPPKGKTQCSSVRKPGPGKIICSSDLIGGWAGAWPSTSAKGKGRPLRHGSNVCDAAPTEAHIESDQTNEQAAASVYTPK